MSSLFCENFHRSFSFRIVKSNYHYCNWRIVNIKKDKRKQLITIVGVCLCLVVGGISAYFTSTDTADNEFKVGSVDINLVEPNWIPPEDVTPNETVAKDPQIFNNGDSPAFTFMRVTIPTRELIVVAPDGEPWGLEEYPIPLFQMSTSNQVEWGEEYDTWNENWKIIGVGGPADCEWWAWYAGLDDAGANTVYFLDEEWNYSQLGVSEETLDDNVVLVFAYADENGCTSLAPGDATESLFETVTVVNAVEGQGLENETFDMGIEVFGIQDDNLGTIDPEDVWSILMNQSGNGANGAYNHNDGPEGTVSNPVNGYHGDSGEIGERPIQHPEDTTKHFTVGDITFTYEEGMTWAEWEESEYHIAGINGSPWVSYQSTSNPEDGFYKLMVGESRAEGSDLMDQNAAYWWDGPIYR